MLCPPCTPTPPQPQDWARPGQGPPGGEGPHPRHWSPPAAGALVLLGFAGLLPRQLVIDVGAKAGPENEARQQDDDQQDQERVGAQAAPGPGGHAQGAIGPQNRLGRGRGEPRGGGCTGGGGSRAGPCRGSSLLPRGRPDGEASGLPGQEAPAPFTRRAARGPTMGALWPRAPPSPPAPPPRAAPRSPALTSPPGGSAAAAARGGHLLRPFQPPTPALPARTQSGPFSAQLAIARGRRRRRRGRAGAGGKEGRAGRRGARRARQQGPARGVPSRPRGDPRPPAVTRRRLPGKRGRWPRSDRVRSEAPGERIRGAAWTRGR